MDCDDLDQIIQIELSNFILRRLHKKDKKTLKAIARNENLLQAVSWKEQPTERRRKYFIFKTEWNPTRTYAIVKEKEDQCIGVLELTYNREKNGICLGYLLHSNYWNLGIMSAIVERTVCFCFKKLQVDYMEASHYAGNFGSGRVLDKAGFEIDFRVHQKVKVEERFVEVIYYTLTREKYEQQKKTEQ